VRYFTSQWELHQALGNDRTCRRMAQNFWLCDIPFLNSVAPCGFLRFLPSFVRTSVTILASGSPPQAGADVSEARAGAGPAGARRGLCLGQPRDPCGQPARGERPGDHPVEGTGEVGAGAGERGGFERPGEHPGAGLSGRGGRAVRRDREHRDGGARGGAADRRVWPAAGGAAPAGWAAAQSRHRPFASFI
jgi:hypothetical protein